MSNPGNNPSLGDDPADVESLGGMLRKTLQKFLQGTDGMLPAKVIAVSEDKQFVTVQPQILVVGTNQKTTERAQIAKVPILWMGAGNFVLYFPVKPDDLGWIVASDRDISLYIQAGKAAKPNTKRLHSFEDAVFIPDNARKFTVTEEDEERAVLQSLDGTVRVAVGDDLVKVVHPTKVRIESPLVEMTGNLDVDGTIHGKTDVLSGGGSISGKNHKHTGVQTGGGTSGGPTN